MFLGKDEDKNDSQKELYLKWYLSTLGKLSVVKSTKDSITLELALYNRESTIQGSGVTILDALNDLIINGRMVINEQ